jgi:acyl-CoA dehydrogenase
MKVTTQGEEVMNLLWDVIAAKGFEKDTYFEMAVRDIRALPKLEGTVHVNVALILKFMANYFFKPKKYSEVSKQSDAGNDNFLFNQGPARGLGKICFHDYHIAYKNVKLPNVKIFKKQIRLLKWLLILAKPTKTQQRDSDFLLTLGEQFTMVVYGQLILENATIYHIEAEVVNQIFDFMVKDFSQVALQMYSKAGISKRQAKLCSMMIKKPVANSDQLDRVWQKHVYTLKDQYRMNH